MIEAQLVSLELLQSLCRQLHLVLPSLAQELLLGLCRPLGLVLAGRRLNQPLAAAADAASVRPTALPCGLLQPNGYLKPASPTERLLDWLSKRPSRAQRRHDRP